MCLHAVCRDVVAVVLRQDVPQRFIHFHTRPASHYCGTCTTRTGNLVFAYNNLESRTGLIIILVSCRESIIFYISEFPNRNHFVCISWFSKSHLLKAYGRLWTSKDFNFFKAVENKIIADCDPTLGTWLDKYYWILTKCSLKFHLLQ